MSAYKIKSPVYIIDGARTIIGSPLKSLKHFSAAQLSSQIIISLLKRNNIKPKNINEVIWGNVVSAGIGQNLARQAAINAGLPFSTIAWTVNNVCGSGMQAVLSGIDAIVLGRSKVVIAGGAESASQAPFFLRREARENLSSEMIIDSLIFDGLRCSLTGSLMGEIVEKFAKQQKLSRSSQDMFALRSHQLAIKAQEVGLFKDEIIQIQGVPSEDDRPRKNISLERLGMLPGAFSKKGTVTAGNSSATGDGAAGLILAGRDYKKFNNQQPLARIAGAAHVFLNPEDVFESPIEAIHLALRSVGSTIKDVDLFEVGEAFAAQAVFVQKTIKIPDEKYNVHGGDIAYGHPLGAAGARILVSLVHALNKRKLRRGLACLCFGGGGAIAIIVDRHE